jgi:hypothetical protein
MKLKILVTCATNLEYKPLGLSFWGKAKALHSSKFMEFYGLTPQKLTLGVQIFASEHSTNCLSSIITC